MQVCHIMQCCTLNLMRWYIDHNALAKERDELRAQVTRLQAIDNRFTADHRAPRGDQNTSKYQLRDKGLKSAGTPYKSNGTN